MQLLHGPGLMARARGVLKKGRQRAASVTQQPGPTFPNAEGGINEAGHRKQLH